MNINQVERLKIFRKYLKLSQIEISNALSLDQSYYSKVENGKIEPSISILNKFYDIYSLNIHWYLTGNGDMFYTDPLSNKPYLNINLERNEAADPIAEYQVKPTGNFLQVNEDFLQLNTVKLANKASNNILVPVKAFGGYLGEWTQEYIDQDLVYVEIPGSPRDARTFEISGTSMEPVIMSGDYVVTKRIEKFEHIKKGHMYVIISLLQGITVKYVYESGDSLILEPANRVEHTPIVLSKADIREIWQVVLRLTKHIIDTEKALYQVQKTKHNPNTNTV